MKIFQSLKKSSQKEKIFKSFESKIVWQQKMWKKDIKICQNKTFIIGLKTIEIAQCKDWKIWLIIKGLPFKLLECGFDNLRNMRTYVYEYGFTMSIRHFTHFVNLSEQFRASCWLASLLQINFCIWRKSSVIVFSTFFSCFLNLQQISFNRNSIFSSPKAIWCEVCHSLQSHHSVV